MEVVSMGVLTALDVAGAPVASDANCDSCCREFHDEEYAASGSVAAAVVGVDTVDFSRS